jgi:hypothetical protein
MKQMKIISKSIILMFFLSLSNGFLFSQILIKNDKSVGTINNTGTIRFKSTGSLIDLPNYIGGTVIYQSPDAATEQVVPNITYNKLIFDSKAWLKIDSFSNTPSASTKPLITRDSLIVRSGFWSNIRNNNVEIRPEGNVRTNGAIKGRKDVAMTNVMKVQSIHGEDSASFSRLRIENPHGVDVEGEFSVTNKLELKRGELRNANANVKIGDANMDRTGADTSDENLSYPLVVRWGGASIESRGDFQEDLTDLHYKGDGVIYTGGENPPVDKNKNIHDLIVTNTDSLVLTENMRVVDSVYVGTHIYTTDVDTLTLASIKNPVFDGDNGLAEVQGHFRRTDWIDGDTLIFNNPYTKLFFKTAVDRTELSAVLSSVFSNRYHDLPGGGKAKVKRMISLRAFNILGQEYTKNIDGQYNYGWRYQGALDETFNLAFEKLLLLHYNGNGEWLPNPKSVIPPQQYLAHKWGYSYTTNIATFGDYAIGTQDANYSLAFSGKVFLEGAYRYSVKRMSNELQMNNYLPMPPPDIYPYNLDTNRVYNFRIDGQFPDSVVDWVVLEFRKDYAVPGSVKTLLLKTDGRLVDMWGNEQVLFHSNGEFVKHDSLGNPIADTATDLESQVYVILRHRNHSAVISDKPIQFEVGKPEFVDFTLPHSVMGGVSSLKAIDRNNSGGEMYLYGMVAGDINKGLVPDGTIDKNDFQQLIDDIKNWSINTLDGYLLHDINLSGTITTMDYNIIFNNRNRTLLVP